MEKRFNVSLYDGAGGATTKHFEHLEDVLCVLKNFVNYDAELLSQFSVTDRGKDITQSVRAFIEKTLPRVLKFRDLKVGDKLYVLGWSRGGDAQVHTITHITIREEENDMLIRTDKHHYRDYLICGEDMDLCYSWNDKEEEDLFIDKETAVEEVNHRIDRYKEFLKETEQIED